MEHEMGTYLKAKLQLPNVSFSRYSPVLCKIQIDAFPLAQLFKLFLFGRNIIFGFSNPVIFC
jgi:hypothetical protein